MNWGRGDKICKESSPRQVGWLGFDSVRWFKDILSAGDRLIRITPASFPCGLAIVDSGPRGVVGGCLCCESLLLRIHLEEDGVQSGQ